MALTVLWKVVRSISGQYFTIMVDETADIANTEQIVLCIRYVDDDLATHEEFIGMRSLDSTTSESVNRTIEDNLLRLSVQLTNCRGQCYDGASTMSVCRTGVATGLCAKEP